MPSRKRAKKPKRTAVQRCQDELIRARTDWLNQQIWKVSPEVWRYIHYGR